MRPDLGDLEVFDISFLANQTVKKKLFSQNERFCPLYRYLAPFFDLTFIIRDINVKKCRKFYAIF
jgi:hypothetical protein